MGHDALVHVGPTSNEIAVEVLADDKTTWIDLNAVSPSAVPDYYGGLLEWPNIDMKTDYGGGILVPTTSTLAMDNAPIYDLSGTTLIPGRSFGLFDAPLPLTLRDSLISSWIGRKVRISERLYNAGGAYVGTEPIATMRIDDVQRDGIRANIKLVDLFKVLQSKSVATIKAGSEWYQNMPVGALISLLIKRSDPDAEVAGDLSSGLWDFGTAATKRVSSWGSCPGAMSDNLPSSYRWIPRCFARSSEYPDYLFVGFEAPGSSPSSDGGLAYFDATTGRWKLILVPGSIGLTGMYPVFMWVSGSTLYWLAHREATPSSTDWSFWRLRMASVNWLLSSGAAYIGTDKNNWPCRDTIRKGTVKTSLPAGDPQETRINCGYVNEIPASAYNQQWFGEPICLPFPQAIECLGPWMFLGLTYTNTLGHWTGYDCPTTGVAVIGALEDYRVIPGLMAPQGHWFAMTYLSRVVTTTDVAGFKYAMTTHPTNPQPYKIGSDVYAYHIYHESGLSQLRFSIARFLMSGAGTWEYWPLTLLGFSTTQLWRRQITAFCMTPGSSGSTAYLWVATIEWNETVGASIPWSAAKLYRAVCSGASGTDATVTTAWSKTPTATDNAPVIVHLWAPWATDLTVVGNWAVAVVLNRGNVSAPCYGLMVIDYSNTVRLSYPSATYGNAPVSSLPFSGFVQVPGSADACRFIDQANGQVWRMDVDPSTFAVTFTPENGSSPVHGSELMCACPDGIALDTTSDATERTFWGLAPSIPGDLNMQFYARTGWNVSARRKGPGVYPLVMLATKVSDVIELADLSEMAYVIDAVRKLKEILPRYFLTQDALGVVQRQQVAVGTPTITLRPQRIYGADDPINDIYCYPDPITRRQLVEDIVNAVDVTPWAPVPGETPEPTVVGAPGSTWKGEIQCSIATQRPIRLAITCVSGGDVLHGSSTLYGAALLFRWSRVLEESHLFLSTACSPTNTTINVSGLVIRGTSFYSGEQRITTGDFVRIGESALLTISSLQAFGASSVRIGFGSQIGVSGSLYSDVTIIPRESSVASDGPNGVTALQSSIVSGDLSLVPASIFAIKTGMVITIDSEIMDVTEVQHDRVVVSRGRYGSAAASHTFNAPIRAYVRTAVVGQMYEVGDTGISMAVVIDPAESDASARTLRVGDGIIVQSAGLKLAKLEHVVKRSIDQLSIDEHRYREKSISDNPFVDITKADLVADSWIEMNSEPRIGVTGVEIPMIPGVDMTTVVSVIDPTVVPGGATESFRLAAIKPDFARRVLKLGLKAVLAIAGSGKRPSDQPWRGRGIVRTEEERR